MPNITITLTAQQGDLLRRVHRGTLEVTMQKIADNMAATAFKTLKERRIAEIKQSTFNLSEAALIAFYPEL